jgi:hypothetical protein
MLKKVLALTIAAALVLSGMPPGPVARADGPPPAVTRVYYKTENDIHGGGTLRYEIRGTNFDDPIVYIEGIGITPTSYNSTIINVQWGPGIDGAIFAPGTKTITVVNSDGQASEPVDFEVVAPPQVTGTNKTKVYIGESLEIYGSGFDDRLKSLYIAENYYSIGGVGSGADAIIQNGGLITVASVKSYITPGVSSIRVTLDAGGGTQPIPGEEVVHGILADCITVVRKLTGIEVTRIEPNTGPVTGGTVIRMYGADGLCGFQDNMKVYIDGVPATGVQAMQDENGEVTGLQAVTPPGTPGTKGVVIKDAGETSEYQVIPEFTYLQAGNFLMLQSIVPPHATETEEREITIGGRNIGTINVGGVVISEQTNSSYDNVNNEYVLTFNGTYNEEDAVITRKIKLTIGEITPITGVPTIAVSGDVLTATTPIITLDPQVPQAMDVVMKTETIISLGGAEQLHRTEEYVMADNFTYIPSRTYPEVTGITPDMGPCDQDIFITVVGDKFQVLTVQEEIEGEMQEITKYPVIKIGTKTIDPNDADADHYVEVYDAEGNRVDGKKYTLGTLIRTKIPGGQHTNPGFVNVTVTNPDLGSETVENMFEFKDPDRDPDDMPVITGITPDTGTINGGTPVTIHGKNFDYDAGEIRVTVTIDGAAAQVLSVKNTGDIIEIITPPGVEGYRTVQVINEDGSMYSLPDGFYYTRISSSPVIDSITPGFGGEGIQVFIRGQDFRVAEPGSELMHRKLGTRVLLDGSDINDYSKDENGEIELDQNGEIVFEPGGRRTYVLDEYTILIIIPQGLLKGLKDVTVVNPDTARYTVQKGFNYLIPDSSPVVTGIDPAEGSVAGGTVVTIEGGDFREGVSVFFGGVEAANVTVNGDGNIIQATTPQYFIRTPGAHSEEVDVTVVNSDGGFYIYTEDGGFTYRIPDSDPFVTSLEPDWGSTAGGDSVIIWGGDFRRKDTDGDGVPDMLPVVYFGGVEAAEVSWGNYNMLVAETPSYPDEGRVDVTVVNPDTGTFIAENAFEYRRSKPAITGVVPDKGTRLGRQEITIKGTDFIKGDLSVNLDGEQVNRHTPEPAAPWIDLLVVLGDEKSSAPISGGKSEVAVGNIRVVYDTTQPGEDNTKLYLIPYSGPDEYISGYNISSGTYHLFIVNGPADLDDSSITDEGIMVEVGGSRLTVTRRLAPYVRHIDQGTIIVSTPPAEFIGERNLYAINRDGGTAAGTFEYTNPDSNPIITDIRPNREMYDPEGNLGGYVTEGSIDAETYITIDGSDFRTGVKVFIDDIPAEVISRSNDDDQLVAKVPPADVNYLGRLLRIVVVNRDGGTADSSLLPIPRWFEYKRPGSGPVIDAVKPDRTSAAGGNEIKIEGDDFRPEATVAIGGVPAVAIRTDDWTYREIFVESPKELAPGVYDVQVINPDYGTATLKDAITIVSWPRIDYITNENGSAVGHISFLGGDTVYLRGSGFMPGARVVFGGEVVTPETPGGGIQGLNSRDQDIEVIGGTEASGVEAVDDGTLRLITPEGVEGEITIVVINPDSGASDEFDISYTLPIPGAPDDLDVSLVYDRYVRLEWPVTEDALYYEIYASERNRSNFRFIASTTRNVYYIIDLDPDTRYYFRVKAVNKYGSSEFTSNRSIRTDDTREGDPDGGINESEKISVDGSTVTVNIGEDALDGRYYYNIDLTDPVYGRIDKSRINIPVKVIRGAYRSFAVDTGGLMMQFSSSALNVAPVWSIGKDRENTAYGRLTIDIPGIDGDRARKYLPAKHRLVSDLYYIGMSVVDGKTEEQFNGFNGPLELQIKYDYSRLTNINESELKLYRFDPAALKWAPADATGVHTNIDLAYGRITKPGIYAVLGKN